MIVVKIMTNMHFQNVSPPLLENGYCSSYYSKEDVLPRALSTHAAFHLGIEGTFFSASQFYKHLNGHLKENQNNNKKYTLCTRIQMFLITVPMGYLSSHQRTYTSEHLLEYASH